MSDAAAATEADIREIKATLGRLEPILTRLDERVNGIAVTMATKDNLATLRGEMREDMATLRGEIRVEFANMRTELASKPSRASMWGMATALIGLVVAAIGVGAAYLPLMSRALHP